MLDNVQIFGRRISLLQYIISFRMVGEFQLWDKRLYFVGRKIVKRRYRM